MCGQLRTLVSGEYTTTNKTIFLTDEGIKLDLLTYEEVIELKTDVEYIAALNALDEVSDILGGALIHAGYIE